MVAPPPAVPARTSTGSALTSASSEASGTSESCSCRRWSSCRQRDLPRVQANLERSTERLQRDPGLLRVRGSQRDVTERAAAVRKQGASARRRGVLSTKDSSAARTRRRGRCRPPRARPAERAPSSSGSAKPSAAAASTTGIPSTTRRRARRLRRRAAQRPSPPHRTQRAESLSTDTLVQASPFPSNRTSQGSCNATSTPAPEVEPSQRERRLDEVHRASDVSESRCSTPSPAPRAP